MTLARLHARLKAIVTMLPLTPGEEPIGRSRKVLQQGDHGLTQRNHQRFVVFRRRQVNDPCIEIDIIPPQDRPRRQSGCHRPCACQYTQLAWI
jgi:hypothetical protein